MTCAQRHTVNARNILPSATFKPSKNGRSHDWMAVKARSPYLSELAHANNRQRKMSFSRDTQGCSAMNGHHLHHHQDTGHDEDVAGPSISLTKKQERFLRLWHEDFAHPDDRPALVEERTTALATAIQTEPKLVFNYIKRRRKGSEDDDQAMLSPDERSASPHQRRDSETSTEPYTLSKANNHLPQSTLAVVEKYISACRRRRSPTDGRRSVNTGPFRCTFGCGYRTKRVFDWRRHEETHEPQELWLCTICSRSELHNPFLVNRKDKFLKHAADKHTHVAAEEVLIKSKLPFVPRAELGCTYCGEESGTWDERCRHVLGHFEDEVERGMKRVKVVHEEGDDDQGIPVSEEGSVSASVASSRDEGEAVG